MFKLLIFSLCIVFSTTQYSAYGKKPSYEVGADAGKLNGLGVGTDPKELGAAGYVGGSVPRKELEAGKGFGNAGYGAGPDKGDFGTAVKGPAGGYGATKTAVGGAKKGYGRSIYDDIVAGGYGGGTYGRYRGVYGAGYGGNYAYRPPYGGVRPYGHYGHQHYTVTSPVVTVVRRPITVNKIQPVEVIQPVHVHKIPKIHKHKDFTITENNPLYSQQVTKTETFIPGQIPKVPEGGYAVGPGLSGYGEERAKQEGVKKGFAAGKQFGEEKGFAAGKEFGTEKGFEAGKEESVEKGLEAEKARSGSGKRFRNFFKSGY